MGRRATIVAGLLLAAPQAHAVDPAAKEAQLLLRVLSYDRNLKSRVGDDVVVGILHRPEDATSTAGAARITGALHGATSLVVDGLPIQVIDVPWAEDAQADDLTRLSIDVLYVCEGLDGDVASIQALSRSLHLLTVGANPSYVAKGLSVSVAPGASTPIVVNVTASKAEGAYFGADLLSIASVVH